MGAHADVGGGYPPDSSGLSDIALAWLSQQLAAMGVQFSAPAAYTPATDQYMQAIHTAWLDPPFNLLLQKSRYVKPTDLVDPSVRSRLNADPTYRPAALSDWRKGHPTAA